MHGTPNIARGGRALYGAPLGILMLEARFPRIPGDMGNATTWPFPVLYRVVRGASPTRVVEAGAAGLLGAFIEAGRDLIDLGAEAITTNCGFLSIFQAELAAALAVPVATSSMLQLPWVQAMLPPGRRVGIVTVNAAGLTPAHLAGAGVPADTPIAGCEGGREFFRILIRAESRGHGCGCLARADVVGAARALQRRHARSRRHRAGMHQHAALCGRCGGGDGAAGLRHLQHDHLVPGRAAAGFSGVRP